MSISYPASRAMSAATAVYGVYALAKPSHLADVMGADPGERPGYDQLARAYGVRDLVISLLGVVGPAGAVRWAMRSRIAGDLADCATLVAKADEGKVRGKVAAVTLGWAALNLAAYRWDRKRR
ncbi:hypothetical protein ISU07_20600 [Nocardioides islandensis]|jgi:hypothetical protein|uniref:Uncharacterized protein n=1 Tax=Nocardioides islandensis TaxID=433663 RepID=A0A930YG25_9ACTN|nr:hypothetical protein [Nocardioides islandensis]MBF4765537.1 hypothetical protein [Nocardioides islandensis]